MCQMIALMFKMAMSLWTLGFEMAISLCTCLQGGRLRMGVPMMLMCVALTRGRVIPSSLPTASPVEQPRAVIYLS
jgi:hypothetical protein